VPYESQDEVGSVAVTHAIGQEEIFTLLEKAPDSFIILFCAGTSSRK
jgi:hypothetical protein